MVVTELGRLGGISVDGRRSVVFPASGQEAQKMLAWMSTVSVETVRSGPGCWAGVGVLQS